MINEAKAEILNEISLFKEAIIKGSVRLEQQDDHESGDPVETQQKEMVEKEKVLDEVVLSKTEDKSSKIHQKENEENIIPFQEDVVNKLKEDIKEKDRDIRRFQ